MSQPITHPSWCSPAECTAETGGSHSTAMVAAGVAVNRPGPIEGYLDQYVGGMPLIVVHAPTGLGELIVLPMAVREAWHLSSILAQLARMAESK